jgi:hypothetical protein
MSHSKPRVYCEYEREMFAGEAFRTIPPYGRVHLNTRPLHNTRGVVVPPAAIQVPEEDVVPEEHVQPQPPTRGAD